MTKPVDVAKEHHQIRGLGSPQEYGISLRPPPASEVVTVSVRRADDSFCPLGEAPLRSIVPTPRAPRSRERECGYTLRAQCRRVCDGLLFALTAYVSKAGWRFIMIPLA